VPDSSRNCLVTGAGRGIGRAVAERLSADGHRVALTARSADQLAEVAASLPGPSLVIPADITASSAVDDLFTAVEKEWATVDILVANAGSGVSGKVADTTDEMWQAQLDVLLTAPFRCMRRAIPAMVDQGWGRIVVLASVASKRGEPYISAYTAAKHGVLGLVRSASAELARTGVTVNAVCPAYVDTPMTDGTVATIAARTGRSPEEARAWLEKRQPIGRLITPEEVAMAVSFCIDNAAVTGQGIDVDGGAIQS
jgi:NAD(P)-dependent dehydrogenase (short-subunit alcohol dehydrogenase family)